MAEEKKGMVEKFIKIFLGDTLSFTILDFLKGAAKGFGGKALGKVGDTAIKRVEDLININPRADLLYVLLTLDEKEAEIFWDKYDKRATDEGFEDTFIKTIAQALPRDKDGKIDFERAKSVYTQILQMDPERFWQIYEELKHDPIAQRARHWLQHGKNFGEALLLGLAEAAGIVSKELQEGVWPWLSASKPNDLKKYPKTAALVRQLENGNKEKEDNLNWFQRLHK